MSIQWILALTGGILTGVALTWNVIAILRGKVRPAFTSWAIWASLDVILALSMYAKNSLNPQMAVASVGATLVFILTCFYGKPGWTTIDRWCLFGGIGAILLWFVTGNATTATIISLVAITLGCFPTYASIIEDPSREDKTVWCLAFTSSLCAMLGTEAFTVDAFLPPTVFVLLQAVTLALLFAPRRSENRA